MVPAWKFKKAKLAELVNDIKVFENDQLTTKNKIKESRHTTRKEVQDLEDDIKKLTNKGNRTELEQEDLDKSRTDLPGKKKKLEDLENRLKKIRIVTNEDLYSPEYKECRAALYDLAEKIKNKNSYIEGLRQNKHSDKVAVTELGWIKEKYYTLKKIHDEFMMDECGKIIDHYR
jgi:predicted RNase H-like nuclease (RuvC/YqgF family)